MMQKTSKMGQSQLFTDRKTQVFLSKFLNGEITELEPVYDPKIGYRYPVVETILGDSTSEDFLHRLYEAGILERRLYDKIVCCPRCNSANISVHYCCPYCKSFNIQKSSLIEHVKCGYMDVEENFRKKNRLVCPKCHEELKKPDIDYRQAGIWCTCGDCRKSFDIPTTAHFCRDCHADSTFEDAVIKEVYAYSLKQEVREETAATWTVITSITEFLEENGFEVESPASLKGKSGANHMFDIAAYNGDEERKVTVIDLVYSKEEAVQEQPVIALFAKTFDVSPDSAYIIAIPRISENGKKMAELYKIKVVEAKNQKEIIKVLEDKLLREG